MSQPMIKVEHLSKQYKIGVDRTYQTFQDAITSAIKSPLKLFNSKANGNDTFWALKDVSFEVEKGEAVGIIGRNGAGKSTLLKILSRITEPTEGRITMRGRVASLLEVGTGFHPELTGRENIYLNGSILGMKKREIDAKFDDIVKFSEIEKFLDTPVKRYSSGMYVRLAFAVAAHLEPEILVVDEVLAVGDAAFQKKCLGKMKEVSSKEGRTVLFVSHNMPSISRLCRQVLLLSEGKVKAIGKAEEIINAYQSETSIHNQRPLNERRDRKGNGIIRVKDIYLQNKSGKILDSIKGGEPVNFVLVAKIQPEGINKNAEVNLVFVDRNEFRLFSLQSEIVGKSLIVDRDEMHFICHVPGGLPLIPGNYGIHFSVLLNSVLADKVLFAKEIEVLASDFFGSSKLPSLAMGSVLIKNEWFTKVEQ